MSFSTTKQLPQYGDTLEASTSCGSVSGEVVLCLDNGLVVLETSDGDRILAARSKFSDQWWLEPMPDRAWEDPAYVKLRRADVQLEVGDHVHVPLAVDAFGDHDGGGVLPLCGTVKAIAEDGATLIDIDSFQLYCDPDYWIKDAMPLSLDGKTGVFWPSGSRIN